MEPWARELPGRPVADGVCFIDRFLPRKQCAQILQELQFALWRPSLTYQRQPDGTYRNVLTAHRVSNTAHEDWFSDQLKEILKRIERQLRGRFGVDPDYLEPWQATDYCRNGKFDYHLDAGYWEGHYAGDRVLTFLLYLTTPLKGGGTHFRALDKLVRARTGRLLVWRNLFANGGCDGRVIHSATPLLRGRKTTLVTWQRQGKYRNTEQGLLGNR